MKQAYCSSLNPSFLQSIKLVFVHERYTSNKDCQSPNNGGLSNGTTTDNNNSIQLEAHRSVVLKSKQEVGHLN